MEQKRDRKRDTANALLISQVTATLAEFLKTQDKRYNYQTDTPQGTTTDSVTPATDKHDRPHTPRSEPKRSRSPTDPPDRPAPSLRSLPEDNDTMTWDQDAEDLEKLLTQESAPRRSQGHTPPTLSVDEKIA